MRFLLFPLLLLSGSLVLPPISIAQAAAPMPEVKVLDINPPADAPAAPAPRDHATILNDLFLSLRKAKTEKAAADIANDIRQEWTHSGSATVDLLMQWADAAVARKDLPAALDFLDQIIVLKPKFAEGWNHRATIHYMMNNYSKSMVDIQKTLELEPRHFGALAGMGVIFLDLKRNEQALRAYERVLEVYPLLRDVQKQVGILEEQLAGSRT
jgi:tetratricopeptide (TPR) repeat protein